MKKFFFSFAVFTAIFLMIGCGSSNKSDSSSNTDKCEIDGSYRCHGKNLQQCENNFWVTKKQCKENCNSEFGKCDLSDTDDDEHSANNDENSNNSDSCADTEGLACTTDAECGACMICSTGGKCSKGCTSDNDCQMSVGLKCNKSLARCLNVLASNKACSEANCPSGCCYAEKGLTGVKCTSYASASVCGLCPLGQIYSPDESRCITSVCSFTTDDCPSLNSEATNPPSKCYECVSGELVCEAKGSASGCSAGTIINLRACIPSGKKCDKNFDQCCSGMPCVGGYCY